MRTTVIALGASLLLLGTGTGTATAATGSADAAVTVDGRHEFSPNGDHRKDTARFTLKLTRRAQVTVTVVRRNQPPAVVRDRLGYLRAGTHAWTWNGRKDNGRRAGDGSFDVVVTARLAGSDVVQKARTYVHLDTVYAAGKVSANGTTVYPHSTVVHDQVWFGNPTPDSRIATGSFVVTDSIGREVFRDTQRFWPHSYYQSAQLVAAWDGRNQQGRVVRAGHYWVRMVGTDKAGNTGRTPRQRVDVSAAPLIEANGSATVTPKDTWQGPAGVGPCDYRGPQDCGIWKPCGEVVDSTTFPEPGSLSYRSSSACADTTMHPHIAVGSHVLSLDPAAMPRGVRTVEVSMVGGPRTAGAPDQGYLYGPGSSQSTASGPDTSVHETSAGIWTNPALANTQPITSVGWSVQTRVDDAYDVKSFTVTYSYLTPKT
jgi:flagellar hook assembly protein FlgD